MRSTLAGLALGLSSIALAASPAAAQDYPDKPVSMIVAYSPGGGTDTAARTLAKFVEPYLGQRLVVENKPGAGGQIGFTALANAEPDGYRIGFINVPSIFLVKMLRENVPFEMSDFVPLASIQSDPAVIAVEADSPYQTLDDLLAAAREQPGKLNIGADGPQSNNQLQLVVAEDVLDVDFNFVPFDGSGPAIKATLGGELAASLPSASSAVSQVESGRLRILGVFANKAYPAFPDAPTVSDATGETIPSIGASIRGVAAPAGIPDDRRAVLEKAFADVMQDEAFNAQAEASGVPLEYLSADEFAAYLKDAEAQVAKYADLMK